MTVEIPGAPVPEGRPRARVLWLGSVPAWVRKLARAQISTPDKTRDYKQDVAQCAMVAKAKAGVLSWTGFPIAVPVSVMLWFYFPKPKRPKWPVPAVKPDLDNLEKSVLDGLVDGGLLQDDALVVDLVSRKRYTGGMPMVRAVVRRYELEQETPF